MRWALALLLLGLGGCVGAYKGAATANLEEERLAPDRWRLALTESGNKETVQAYLLYRAAALTLEQGYDGFRHEPGTYLVEEVPDFAPFRVAATVPMIIPIFLPPSAPPPPAPTAIAYITLLKGPITPERWRVFDARRLQAALRPYIEGERCTFGNVCPHPHSYLYDP